MPDVPISQQDIDSLAHKLGRLEPELTESEKALLAFMFSVAADAIRRSESDTVASPLVSLTEQQDAPVVVSVQTSPSSIRDQFASAFTPARPGVKPVPGSIGPGSRPAE
ncbi:hypothetical protein JOF56_008800 [Kibdelosporangium banguiense]|uniref:Uncharacterized protein n=1 Tax=Kibdelosporangium banguiense TaxID=1365924 RepID=A0ABS4TWT1_9PSEU|nr:hypothetical protein [Kibdelosporangium banguiense]MBP2328415.1 hypothetical protein [Kibdelosporangium banguiense]